MVGMPGWSEEEEKQLTEALGGDAPEDDEDDKPEEPVEDAPPAEPEPAPAEEPEKSPEPSAPAPAKGPTDSQGWARLRYEAKKAEERAEELRLENERLKNPPRVIPAEDENFEGHIKGRVETTEERLERLEKADQARRAADKQREDRDGAFRELQNYENETAAKHDDFGDASTYVKSMIAASIKLLNPDITREKLAEETLNQYAIRAGNAYNNGKHPGDAIYEMASTLGYKKAVPPANDDDNESSKLATIAANKKKSTNMIGSTGSGGKGETTLKSLANAPQSELQKLSEAELDRLIYGNVG